MIYWTGHFPPCTYILSLPRTSWSLSALWVLSFSRVLLPNHPYAADELLFNLQDPAEVAPPLWTLYSLSPGIGPLFLVLTSMLALHWMLFSCLSGLPVLVPRGTVHTSVWAQGRAQALVPWPQPQWLPRTTWLAQTLQFSEPRLACSQIR